MAIIEGTPRSLVLRLGSTTLTLDKDSDKAVLQRRLLFWTRRPIERRMSQIVEVTVDKRIDRASGVELCKTKLNGAIAAYALSAFGQMRWLGYLGVSFLCVVMAIVPTPLTALWMFARKAAE